jgi:hypothetical protein
MMARTQISLDPELRSLARRRASQRGMSLARYIRDLVARDLASPRPAADPALVFNLGASGGADVARDKDKLVGEAVAAARRRAPRRRR